MSVDQTDTANNTLCHYCFQGTSGFGQKAPGAHVFGYCPILTHTIVPLHPSPAYFTHLPRLCPSHSLPRLCPLYEIIECNISNLLKLYTKHRTCHNHPSKGIYQLAPCEIIFESQKRKETVMSLDAIQLSYRKHNGNIYSFLQGEVMEKKETEHIHPTVRNIVRRKLFCCRCVKIRHCYSNCFVSFHSVDAFKFIRRLHATSPFVISWRLLVYTH